MNRTFLAALALAAAGVAVYLLVDSNRATPAPAPASAGAAGQSAPEPKSQVPLSDPRSTPPARADLERPTDAPRVASQASSKSAPGAAPTPPAQVKPDPGMPNALPAAEDAADAELLKKYASATPDEKRQALESLGLTYKDAVAGRIKGSDQLIKELELEMQWLESHMDR